MNTKLIETIQSLGKVISPLRQESLQPLVEYIRNKVATGNAIRLNFICTHNSRRSHLSQIWAQTMAFHFKVKNISCYSGGTEATAMFPKIKETLINQGFDIMQLSESSNPVYAVKYDANEAGIICFSKCYDHAFNPQNQYAAIMTCNHADEGCPIVIGAEARFSIKYDDPKISDDTDLQDKIYAERSLEIANEMMWVFGRV